MGEFDDEIECYDYEFHSVEMIPYAFLGKLPYPFVYMEIFGEDIVLN